jgi:hypothetical protein
MAEIGSSASRRARAARLVGLCAATIGYAAAYLAVAAAVYAAGWLVGLV